MTAKRVNDKFHRLDVKLPVTVYEQVSAIAVNFFDAKIHHISGKPELSSTLIYLLQLGIESLVDGKTVKKIDTDTNTDILPISVKQVEKMIDDKLKPIYDKLNSYYTDTNTDINTDINTNNVYFYNSESTIDSKPIMNTDTLTDNILDEVNQHLKIDDRNELANDSLSIQSYEPLRVEKTEIGLIDNILSVVKDQENVSNTLLESSILPLNKDLRDKLGNAEINEIKSDISEIGSFKDAIDLVILPELVKGTKQADIAKMLQGKYFASHSGKGTNWPVSIISQVNVLRKKRFFEKP